MNDNAKAWVEALDSDKYEQGDGALCIRTPDGDKYCCLGVACDLAVKAGVVAETVEAEGENDVVYFGASSDLLPPEVEDWLGLRSENGSYGVGGEDTSFVTDNDVDKKSLSEIAAIIRSEPEGLFA